jgi:uncharacterized FAD-dependent dehydrogenase
MKKAELIEQNKELLETAERLNNCYYENQELKREVSVLKDKLNKAEIENEVIKATGKECRDIFKKLHEENINLRTENIKVGSYNLILINDIAEIKAAIKQLVSK